MMKRKILRAFLGVYAALCVTYFGGRTVVAAVLDGAAPVTREEPAPEAGTSATHLPESTPSPTPSPAPKKTEEEATASPSGPAESAPTEEPSTSPEPELTAEEDVTSEESTPEEAEEESLDGTEESPTEEAQFQEPQEEVPAYEEPEPAPEIPSLEEYLSQFRCGGCGRGCLLCSPRCRTGSRKAASATEDYYAQYGAYLS